jgi:membrane-associated protease RseP (regulator of RpoE activity)
LSATAGEVFKYIGFIIVAILALMLMIIIHESGHYLAGKMLKFRIDEFSIGFGPAIFKRRNKKNGAGRSRVSRTGRKRV